MAVGKESIDPRGTTGELLILMPVPSRDHASCESNDLLPWRVGIQFVELTGHRLLPFRRPARQRAGDDPTADYIHFVDMMAKLWSPATHKILGVPHKGSLHKWLERRDVWHQFFGDVGLRMAVPLDALRRFDEAGELHVGHHAPERPNLLLAFGGELKRLALATCGRVKQTHRAPVGCTVRLIKLQAGQAADEVPYSFFWTGHTHSSLLIDDDVESVGLLSLECRKVNRCGQVS
jgi:hypothetical protein